MIIKKKKKKKKKNRYRFLDEHDNTTSYFDTYWIKFKNIGQAR